MSEINSSQGDDHPTHDSHSKHEQTILTPEEVDAILEKLESEVRRGS